MARRTGFIANEVETLLDVVNEAIDLKVKSGSVTAEELSPLFAVRSKLLGIQPRVAATPKVSKPRKRNKSDPFAPDDAEREVTV